MPKKKQKKKDEERKKTHTCDGRTSSMNKTNDIFDPTIIYLNATLHTFGSMTLNLISSFDNNSTNNNNNNITKNTGIKCQYRKYK